MFTNRLGFTLMTCLLHFWNFYKASHRPQLFYANVRKKNFHPDEFFHFTLFSIESLWSEYFDQELFLKQIASKWNGLLASFLTFSCPFSFFLLLSRSFSPKLFHSNFILVSFFLLSHFCSFSLYFPSCIFNPFFASFLFLFLFSILDFVLLF